MGGVAAKEVGGSGETAEGVAGGTFKPYILCNSAQVVNSAARPSRSRGCGSAMPPKKCAHLDQTRAGSINHQRRVSCKSCGTILFQWWVNADEGLVSKAMAPEFVRSDDVPMWEVVESVTLPRHTTQTDHGAQRRRMWWRCQHRA